MITAQYKAASLKRAEAVASKVCIETTEGASVHRLHCDSPDMVYDMYCGLFALSGDPATAPDWHALSAAQKAEQLTMYLRWLHESPAPTMTEHDNGK